MKLLLLKTVFALIVISMGAETVLTFHDNTMQSVFAGGQDEKKNEKISEEEVSKIEISLQAKHSHFQSDGLIHYISLSVSISNSKYSFLPEIPPDFNSSYSSNS